MGCTNSKETLRRAGVAGDERPGIRSLPRCLSTPIPHSKDTEDRKYHPLVSLDSATYGDLDFNMNKEKEAVFFPRNQEYREGFYGNNHRGNFDRSSSLVAKTWSEVNGLLSDYKQKNAPAADHRQETKEEVDVARNRINMYIRSSLRTVFAQMMEQVDSRRRSFKKPQNPPSALTVLANDIGDLARNGKETFSPILKRWHPFAAGVAVATLHACYGRELK